MSNILPFRQRSRAKKESQAHLGSEDAQVLDVTEKIAATQEEERRKISRVVLNEFVSAHVYVTGRGLLRVVLKDIHDTGLAFEIEHREGHFDRGEILEMRFYMNHETYFRFSVQVMHFTPNSEEGFHRHGCQFVKDTLNDVALHHFIGFLQNVSASLRTDRGDRTISNIYSS